MRIRSRWVAGAVVSLLATTVSATAGPTAVVRAAPPYPIYEVSLPLRPFMALDSVTSVSPDGRFSTIVTGGVTHHLALPFGEQPVETRLADFRADSGGVFAYRLGDRDTVQLLRVADGTITEIEIPAVPLGDVGDIVDIDAAGRVFLFRGALYDSVSGAFERFNSGSFQESARTGVALSDDGRYVTAREADFAGGIGARTITVRYDRTGQTSAVVASPPSADDPYNVSPSLEWLVTFSGFVSGPGVGPTVIRQHVPTGVVDVVPVDAALVRGFNVDDDGRVVVSHVVPTAANPGAVQLSLWPRSRTTVPVARIRATGAADAGGGR